MDFSLIKQIISEIEEFSRDKNSNSLEDFRHWLNNKAYERENPKNIFSKFDINVNDIENEICKQILLLNRFSRQMIRKGLNNYPELVNEDFTYLYRLMDYKSLTKMQLVEKNGHEKQTGIEIIKRLIRNGLVDEYNDTHDKRSKRLKVSEEGINVFKNSAKDVARIARILSANLSENEKDMFLQYLKKLNQFHFTVYHEYKDSSIEEINNLIE